MTKRIVYLLSAIIFFNNTYGMFDQLELVSSSGVDLSIFAPISTIRQICKEPVFKDFCSRINSDFPNCIPDPLHAEFIQEVLIHSKNKKHIAKE